MKRNKVTICTGTACFVMGGSELLLLEEMLPAELKAITDVEGATCLGTCKLAQYAGKQADHAPFAMVNGKVIEQANANKIIELLNTAEV